MNLLILTYLYTFAAALDALQSCKDLEVLEENGGG